MTLTLSHLSPVIWQRNNGGAPEWRPRGRPRPSVTNAAMDTKLFTADALLIAAINLAANVAEILRPSWAVGVGFMIMSAMVVRS